MENQKEVTTCVDKNCRDCKFLEKRLNAIGGVNYYYNYYCKHPTLKRMTLIALNRAETVNNATDKITSPICPLKSENNSSSPKTWKDIKRMVEWDDIKLNVKYHLPPMKMSDYYTSKSRNVTFTNKSDSYAYVKDEKEGHIRIMYKDSMEAHFIVENKL